MLKIQCTKSNLYVLILYYEIMNICDKIPNSHEGESQEKTKCPSKFSHKRLPRVDQLFSLHLKYNIWSLKTHLFP